MEGARQKLVHLQAIDNRQAPSYSLEGLRLRLLGDLVPDAVEAAISRDRPHQREVPFRLGIVDRSRDLRRCFLPASAMGQHQRQRKRRDVELKFPHGQTNLKTPRGCHKREICRI
jgi:hypothetical protein